LYVLTLINYRTDETKRNEIRKTLPSNFYYIYDFYVGILWYTRRNSHN